MDKVDALIRRGAAGLDTDAAIDLADAALAAGREAEAAPLVLAAAEHHRNHAGLWQWSGVLHRALDRHREALAAFGHAARLAPADVLIAHSLAQTSLEAGLRAVQQFERACALAPDNGELLIGRAAARCAQGDYSEAIAELDTLLARHPGWLAGHGLAAQLRWMVGDRERFTVSIERALAATPRSPELWRALFDRLAHADRFEELLAAATRAGAVLGEHPIVLTHRAIALSELRYDAEAEALFARLAEINDISISVRWLRHLLRTGRPAEAAQLAEPLVRLGDAGMVWPYLGLAWRLLGDERWAWYEGRSAFIGTYDLTAALPPLDQLADLLRDLHRTSAQPLDQSLRGGSQTDGNLLQRIDPLVAQLRGAVSEAVRAFVAALPDRDEAHPLLRYRRDRPVRFGGAWSVRLAEAGYHANHNHPAGWISSALYVAVPPVAPDRAGWLQFGVPQAELGIDLPPIREIEPLAGRLVLFPSTMWHGTLPFPAGERMTVAFDVAPPRP